MKKIRIILTFFICVCIGLSSYNLTYAQESSEGARAGAVGRSGINAIIDEHDSLWTWGINDLGDLGTGTTNSVSVPTKVLTNVDSVYAQTNHMAALKNDGSLWMWGDNMQGQLGIGNSPQATTPKKVMDNVQSVNLEFSSSSAIKNDASLWVWGYVDLKAFGMENDADFQYTPIKVMDNVKKFVKGFNSYMVLKTDGTLWKWEYDPYAYPAEPATEPEKVMDNVIDIEASSQGALAAIKSDYTLWMSGYNGYGQLGNGTTEDVDEFIQVMSNVENIVFSNSCTLAKTMSGDLYRWGEVITSNLDSTIQLTPEKIMDNVRLFYENYGSTTFTAITNDNDLYMWGNNYDAVVGNGEAENFIQDPLKILSNVKDVFVGYTSCVATKTDNTYWVWGKNYLLETSNLGLIKTPTQIHLDYKPKVSFSDVPVSAWFYTAINYVNEKGIMTGMKEGYFGATSILSRAQFATILYRMSGSEAVEYEKKYPDVPQGTFYTDAVMWASKNGIITGYTEGPTAGRFGASDSITREQMAVMMYRYAKFMGETQLGSVNVEIFPDGKKTSEFAREALGWAIGAGLITGNADGTLAPQGTASRAVCATIMMRYMQRQGS